MSSAIDALSPPAPPNRVYYSLGRMLGVDDFQADQDYHRGRLARAILQICGTGTVSGLKVVLNQNWEPNTAYPTWAYVIDSNNSVEVNLGIAGTSAAAAPTPWATTAGGHTTDNNLTWTNVGTPGSWQPEATFAAIGAVADSNGNLQILTAPAPFTSGPDTPIWNAVVGGVTPDGGIAAAWTCIGSKDLEILVTPGIAIDRVGRIIEVPRAVCIRVAPWLANQTASDLNQALKQTTATPAAAFAIVADVFATFVGCTRGVTPCFAAQDDYDATDAFSPNRLLDSFAMQLVLRPDVDLMGTPPTPNLPQDPWRGVGPISTPPSPPAQTLQQHLLDATIGPGASNPFGSGTTPAEIPFGAGLDPSSVFLARILIPAAAVSGQAPVANLAGISIDNFSRLFLYPASLVARWIGLTSGAES